MNFYYELEKPYCLTKKTFQKNWEYLNPNEIYAETKYSVVSTGTEVAAWNGTPPLRPSTLYPRLIGYCNLAKVIEKGSDVNNVSIGDYILTHQSHRSSFVCSSNEVLLKVTEASDDMLKKLTAVYLYHLGYDALQSGNYKPGHKVAVIGLGTLGLTTSSLLASFGAQPIVFTNQKLDKHLFEKWGFKETFRKDMNVETLIENPASLGSVDIVINTSNKWDDYLLSLKLLKKRGTMVCLGFPGRGESSPTFNPLASEYFYDKQLTLKSCGYTTDLDCSEADLRFTKKRNLEYLSSLIHSEKINPLDLLTITSSYKDLESVYKKLDMREPNQFSALIDWSA